MQPCASLTAACFSLAIGLLSSPSQHSLNSSCSPHPNQGFACGWAADQTLSCCLCPAYGCNPLHGAQQLYFHS